MLFSNKAWWGHNTIGNDWHFVEKPVSDTTSNQTILTTEFRRPKTGEETRTWLWTQLILGAKGFAYDREYTSPINDSIKPDINGWTSIGIGNGQDDYNNRNLVYDSNFIYRDDIGSDFLDLHNDYSQLQFFIDTNYVKTYMGINPNRIYIGRKSVRLELKKVHDYTDILKDKLCNLRFLACYGKGYKGWYIQDPNYIFIQYTPNFLDSIVNLNNIRTRRIGDTLPNGMPRYESIDSSFFDVTCLVDSTEYPGTDPFKQSYYIAIQNRRTDPLIRVYDTLMQPSPIAKNINIPLKYNINSVEDHRYTLLRVRELGIGTWLDTLWYRQAPYTHRIDTIVGNDSVLVVRLLPGEAKILNIEVIHSFDKLFGNLAYSNQRKMVAYPIPIVDIFGHEIGQSSDSVRYHLVYQKLDSIANRYKIYYARSEPTIKNQHYESLDWEISDICLSDSIDLKYVTLSGDCRRQFADSMNGFYPALVIRKDPIAQKSKVYAVFSANFNLGGLTCAPPRASDTSYIVETILLENETFANLYLNKHLGTAIGRFKGRISSTWDTLSWGTPMINASSTGNYYTWSDSVKHIFAGWKRPQDTVFRNSKDSINLCWYNHNGGWTPPKKIWAQHPSLNTYSRLDYNQEDCALVWQEKLDPRFNRDSGLHSFNKYQVYYTRLRKDQNDSLVSYISKQFCNTPIDSNIVYSFDSTIIWLPECCEEDREVRNNFEHTLPMVYRSVAFYSQLNRMYSYDRIYWEGKGLFWNDTATHYFIYNTGMDLIDTPDNWGKYVPLCWNVFSSFRIKSPVYQLASPDAAQGCLKLDSLNHYTDLNDSIVVMSFLSSNNMALPQYQNWHINHSLWGLFNAWDTLYWDFTNYKYAHPLVVGNSIWPHQAAYYKITNEDDYHIGRRVFQTADNFWQLLLSYGDIISSMQYFYKKNKDDEIPTRAYFGFKTITNPDENINEVNMVTPIRLDNGDSTFRTMDIIPYYKQGISYFPKDTIYSSWFNVQDIQNVEFESFGRKKSNNDLIKIIVERERDKHKYEIPISLARNDNYSHHKVLLMNGRNERFRFVWEKVKGNSTYSEELLIGQPPYTLDNNNDTLYSRTGSYNNNPYDVIVDLNDSYDFTNSNEIIVNLYPDPAVNTVNVIAKLPVSEFGKGNQDIIITMYTSIGKELQRKTIHTGDILSIPLEMYSSGAYFIKAEIQPDYYGYQQFKPVLKSFVIQR
ncbi:MAG: hypothetical protein ABSG15_04535 [FCB group bacterium]